MAIPKDFLWDTIAQLTDEVERLDPQSIIAARVRGLLIARDMNPMVGDRHPRQRTAIDDDRIATLYLSGLSLEDVREQTGHAIQTIVAALERRGVERRRPGERQKATKRRSNQEQIERVREMRGRGLTLQEIGNELGITRERVRQICKRNGIDSTKRPLKPEELAIVAEYIAGDAIYTVAEKHGLTETRLKSLIVRSGNKVRPSRRNGGHQPSTLANAERAAQLYAEGKRIEEIGRALGIAAPNTYRLLAIAGVRPNRNHRMVAA